MEEVTRSCTHKNDRWVGPHSFTNTATHCLEAARYTLATLQPKDFIWTPYDEFLAALPSCCTNGYRSWRCDTYIICWEIVEAHLPSRVLRQFSMSQAIPTNVLFTPQEHKRIHKMKKGRTTNWENKHNDYIQQWHSRHEHTVHGDLTDNFMCSAEYMNWYWERTVVHVVNPSLNDKFGFQNTAGQRELLMEGMTRMYQQQGNWAPGNEISQIPERYMTRLDAGARLIIEPIHMSQDSGSFPMPPPAPVQRMRRRRNTPRGRTDVHTTMNDDSQGYQPPPATNFQDVGQSSFQAFGGSTFEVGGSSNQIPDLNASNWSENVHSHMEPVQHYNVDEMFNMMAGTSLTSMMTPTPATFDSTFYSPHLAGEPPRRSLSHHSHDEYTPIPFHLNSPMYTPESLNVTLHSPQDLPHTPEEDPFMAALGDWNLVRDRAARQRRPRGPCITSERHRDEEGHHQ